MSHKFIVEAGEQTQLSSDGGDVESTGGLGCWQPVGGYKGNKCLSGEGAKREKGGAGAEWKEEAPIPQHVWRCPGLPEYELFVKHSTVYLAGTAAKASARCLIPAHGGPVLLRGTFSKLLEFP